MGIVISAASGNNFLKSVFFALGPNPVIYNLSGSASSKNMKGERKRKEKFEIKYQRPINFYLCAYFFQDFLFLIQQTSCYLAFRDFFQGEDSDKI